MTSVDAFIAANRFGLGPRLGGLSGIAHDPRGWLLRQLGTADGTAPHLAGLPSAKSVLAEFIKVRRDPVARMKFNKEKGNPLYIREAMQRTAGAIETDTPFRERLVRFWSNHFTVSIMKGPVRKFAGAYEREAIRPHVTGRFEDLLLAVVRHPAMLMYLDNVVSIGPNSKLGRRRNRGLNENLSREILELYTLGVDGGYKQADIIALARMLTGWTVAGRRQSDPGAFVFLAPRHEPGPKTFLDRRFSEDGENEAEEALRMLARHPATARFIATKLARHFIADDPPDTAVRALERRYLDTGGDLREVFRALVMLEEPWRDPLAKVKTGEELVISAMRLVGPPKKKKQILSALRLLGQMPFGAPSPAGWPDVAAAWIGPESLIRRIELMELLAKRSASSADPRGLADQALAAVARQSTIAAIGRAESRREALALLLASPEFQRR